MNMLFHIRVNWPPRSSDLMPSNYFLWCSVKAHIYVDKPASIDALEDNVREFIRENRILKYEIVCQNLTKQMNHLRAVAINIMIIAISFKH